MIYVLSGGGGTGCTLVVTGVAGDNVTVSKDGKTYSKTFKDDGIATFKGLKSGTWTVTMTGSSGTATRTVDISADYSLTITYFSATINVTYPEGSTCTATDGTTTLSAPDTSGTWACVVPNVGDWTVTMTDGIDTATETVTISAEGQVETLEMAYGSIIKNGVLASNYIIKATANQWPGYSTISTSITYPGGYVDLTNTGGGTAGYYMIIDCTKWSTLAIDWSYSRKSGNIYYGYLSIDTKPITSNNYTTAISSTIIKAGNLDRTTTNISLSNITGEKYFCITIDDTQGITAKIYNITLS